MKALITGASGFIGSHLAEKLKERGWSVTCLVRDTSSLQWISSLNVHIITGSLADKDFLNQAVKGHDYVFHVAGLTKTSQREKFYVVNSAYTKNIIEAVAESNPHVKRFLYVSSLSAFGPGRADLLPSEDQTPHPVSDYGKSKLRGENAVMTFSGRVAVTILRPCAVYGPRDRDFLLIFKLIKKGFLPFWGEGNISLLHVDDFIDSMIIASQHEQAVGQKYFVSDGVVYTSKGIIDEIASYFNVKVIKVTLPLSLFALIGFFGDITSKIMRKNVMINSDKLQEIRFRNWVCDISKAKMELGFVPKIHLKQGIKGTADWYKNHKWI